MLTQNPLMQYYLDLLDFEANLSDNNGRSVLHSFLESPKRDRAFGRADGLRWLKAQIESDLESGNEEN
jgi:hypothetical protein